MKLTESQLRKIIKEELATTIKTETLSEGFMRDVVLKFIAFVAPNVAMKILFFGIIGIRKKDPQEAERLLTSAPKEVKTALYMLALKTPYGGPYDKSDRDFITMTVMGGDEKALPDTSGGMPPVSTDTIQESKRRR